MIGAVSIGRSPKFHFRFVGSFHSVTYPAFLKQLVRRYRGRRIHLIADNAKRHTSTTVLEWVQADEENIEVSQRSRMGMEGNVQMGFSHQVLPER